MKITKRLILIIVIITIVAQLVPTLGFSGAIMALRSRIDSIYEDISWEVRFTVEAALFKEEETALETLAKSEAEDTNRQFVRISDVLEREQRLMEKIYADPESYEKSAVSVDNFWNEGRDNFSLGYALAPGVEETDEIKQELSLLSNLGTSFTAAAEGDGFAADRPGDLNDLNGTEIQSPHCGAAEA